MSWIKEITGKLFGKRELVGPISSAKCDKEPTLTPAHLAILARDFDAASWNATADADKAAEQPVAHA